MLRLLACSVLLVPTALAYGAQTQASPRQLRATPVATLVETHTHETHPRRPRSALEAFAPSHRHLPPTARHGPATALSQYPQLWRASGRQRRAAARLIAVLRATTRTWSNPRAAARAGFDTRTARALDGPVGYLHAEHRRYSADRHYLDPKRPEALIYANVPGRPLRLVGVMFSVPRGVHGPTPGGPITRWHTHRVCVRGHKRGLSPRSDGSCPAGATRHQGSEMLHVWFTHDLRSEFAIHAPEPELCAQKMLPAALCRGVPHHVM